MLTNEQIARRLADHGVEMTPSEVEGRRARWYSKVKELLQLEPTTPNEEVLGHLMEMFSEEETRQMLEESCRKMREETE